jgi:alpha-tubulin suppressor-like RCC1 family protein
VRNVAGTGPLTGVRQIALGSFHACARLASGQLRCWGANFAGQVGDDSGVDSWALPRVTVNTLGTGPLTGVTQVDANGPTTCARLANRQARCWGYGQYGNLGNGSDDDSGRPVAVRNVAGTANLSAVAEVTVASDATCARLTNGEGRCWGHNENGQLGAGFNSSESSLPRIVVNAAGNANLTGALDLDGGAQHFCVRVANRQLRCWGMGVLGQLGNGLPTSTNRPVPVKARTGSANLTGVTQFTGGGAFTCARLTTGQAACWGYNGRGGLGNGGTGNRFRPVLVQA